MANHLSDSKGVLLQLDRLTAHPGLRDLADAALATPPLAVTDKPAPPPGGTLHDFYSVGPYWWPDPTKPDGVPYIRRDGQVNPDFHTDQYDRQRVERMADSTLPLALAAKLTGKSRYADHAAMLIRTWFLAPATRMSPHLLNGQAIPGICTGRGIGLIDTWKFVNVIDAAVIALPAAELDSLRRWFADYLEWLLTHPYGIAERNEHNNHGTWFDVQAAAYAIFVGRLEVAREILAAAGAGRIEKHVAADGSQPHELARTRSFTYSCFNLQGLLALAWLGRHVDVDLWPHPRLRAAVDFLAPYADPQRPWPFPELADEPHLPSPRKRLSPLLRQAAWAWGDRRYTELADAADADDVIGRVCWAK